jgi:hypothetical protein
MENTITTTRKIGKITYIITASSSENASDTLEQKVEKLIIKHMRQNADNSVHSAEFLPHPTNS